MKFNHVLYIIETMLIESWQENVMTVEILTFMENKVLHHLMTQFFFLKKTRFVENQFFFSAC